MKRFTMARWMVWSFTAFSLAFATAVSVAAAPDPTPPASAQNADYVAGEKFVASKDWRRAAEAFERAAASDPTNADAWNMLGYSRRWIGDMRAAFAAYDRALALDPNHRGANQYLGIAYLNNKDVVKARVQLAKLETICGKNCDEYKQLADALAKYPAK